jgi:hypothetical protein
MRTKIIPAKDDLERLLLSNNAASASAAVAVNAILLEDGTDLLAEDGSTLLTET